MSNTKTAPSTRRQRSITCLRRPLAVTVGWLIAALALPGTAHAVTEPGGAQSNPTPLISPAINQTATGHTSLSAWLLASSIALVVALIILAFAITTRRRPRRSAETTIAPA